MDAFDILAQDFSKNSFRPTSGMPRMRPSTGRPTTSKPKQERKVKREENNLRITETEQYEDSYSEIPKELTTDEKFELLESQLGDHKQEFEKMIQEENERIQFIERQKQKLDNIVLIEQNKDNLYEWKTLFSKSRPVSAYVGSNLNYKHKSNTEILTGASDSSTEGESPDQMPKEESEKFIFPLALIDAPEDVVKSFIQNPKSFNGKNEVLSRTSGSFKLSKSKGFLSRKSTFTETISNKTKTSGFYKRTKFTNQDDDANAIRPQSVFSPRTDNDCFYLSKAFSDYYTESLSDFAKKFPLIRAKVKCDSKGLRRALSQIKKLDHYYENNSTMQGKQKGTSNFDDDLVIEKRELNLAGNSKNIGPLLKCVYNQIYPNSVNEEIHKHNLYRKPKPDQNKTKANENIQVKSFLKRKASFDSIKFETYDENDPDIVNVFKSDQNLHHVRNVDLDNLIFRDHSNQQKETSNENEELLDIIEETIQGKETYLDAKEDNIIYSRARPTTGFKIKNKERSNKANKLQNLRPVTGRVKVQSDKEIKDHADIQVEPPAVKTGRPYTSVVHKRNVAEDTTKQSTRRPKTGIGSQLRNKTENIRPQSAFEKHGPKIIHFPNNRRPFIHKSNNDYHYSSPNFHTEHIPNKSLPLKNKTTPTPMAYQALNKTIKEVNQDINKFKKTQNSFRDSFQVNAFNANEAKTKERPFTSRINDKGKIYLTT